MNNIFNRFKKQYHRINDEIIETAEQYEIIEASAPNAILVNDEITVASNIINTNIIVNAEEINNNTNNYIVADIVDEHIMLDDIIQDSISKQINSDDKLKIDFNKYEQINKEVYNILEHRDYKKFEEFEEYLEINDITIQTLFLFSDKNIIKYLLSRGYKPSMNTIDKIFITPTIDYHHILKRFYIQQNILPSEEIINKLINDYKKKRYNKFARVVLFQCGLEYKQEDYIAEGNKYYKVNKS